MKLKNVWKYTALIGCINLIAILFYLIGIMVICGADSVIPLWTSQWFGISLFIIVFSVFIAAIVNIREIINIIIEFLNE